MRHAQYRQELADELRRAGIRRDIYQDRAPDQADPPTVTVVWTGTTKDRQTGWIHAYDIEIKTGDVGRELDELVAAVCRVVDVWKPNTSAANASAPRARPTSQTFTDVAYTTVLVSTTVIEPHQIP